MANLPPHAYGCCCTTCVPDDDYEACEGDYGQCEAEPDTLRPPPPVDNSLEARFEDLIDEVAYLRHRVEALEGRAHPALQTRDTLPPSARACYCCGKPVVGPTATDLDAPSVCRLCATR